MGEDIPEKQLSVDKTPIEEQSLAQKALDDEARKARDRAFLRRMLEVLIIGLIIPSIFFGYPEDKYKSVTEWMDVGQAQLDVIKVQDRLDVFWSDDLLGDFFQNITTAILWAFISYAWNPLMENPLLRYVIAIILAGMIYDLAKKAVMSLYSNNPDKS